MVFTLDPRVNDLYSTRYEQIGSTRLPFDRSFSRVNVISAFEHIGLIQNPVLRQIARSELLESAKRIIGVESVELSQEEEAKIEVRKKEVIEARSHDVLIETNEILTVDDCRRAAKRKASSESVDTKVLPPSKVCSRNCKI